MVDCVSDWELLIAFAAIGPDSEPAIDDLSEDRQRILVCPGSHHCSLSELRRKQASYFGPVMARIVCTSQCRRNSAGRPELSLAKRVSAFRVSKNLESRAPTLRQPQGRPEHRRRTKPRSIQLNILQTVALLSSSRCREENNMVKPHG